MNFDTDGEHICLEDLKVNNLKVNLLLKKMKKEYQQLIDFKDRGVP